MTIAIIGTGNMGGAIARGLIKSGAYRPEEIICTAKTDATLESIRTYNPALRTTKDNAKAVRESNIVILAVKPWLIKEVIDTILPAIDYKRQTIVSVAAGITLQELTSYLKTDTQEDRVLPIFRAVPNTAVETLYGVTFIAASGATSEQTDTIYSLFANLGYTLVVKEKQIQAGTSLASCGIAFAMRYIRAAMEGGIELGFRPKDAENIVAHTVMGAASLVLENEEHPEVAIDKVTTAGGITIKGLNAMEKYGFTTAVIEGLKASK